MTARAKFEIGIDEVGRGPLAGPIALCALIMLNPKILKQFPKNCDSKHFLAKKREEIYSLLKEEKQKGNLSYRVAYSSPTYIDRYGIEKATQSALLKTLRKLKVVPASVTVMLDGRLKAPPEYIHQKTYIKGDARIQIIGLASIVAKVERDRKMHRLGKVYPQYGFSKNMGYGTKGHISAIKKYGITPIHRRSFLRNIIGTERSLAK